MQVQANGITIEVEDSGADGTQSGRPVVLLIMGLAMQLIAWPDAFVRGLVDAGYRVVRHDNRDIGLSQGFSHLRQRNLVWQTLRSRVGLSVRGPYGLKDMAQDSLGVLDALGIRQAHIVGVSMGGMIAQRAAILAPQRIQSLTSIMSSSGARGLPGPDPKVFRALMTAPVARTEEALLAQSLGFIHMIASPGFPEGGEEQRLRVLSALQRAYRPGGIIRQMLAVGSDTTRASELSRIVCPALVLHGEQDRLVHIECGRDTARRILGARFVGVPGMGHDLPPGVVEILLAHMLPFLVESRQ